MSSVLFTVLTLPLNMIPLWTKLTVKIQQVFLLPSRFLVLVWHLGESLYPTISKNKTSESSSLSKQIKLNDINILSWKISSILWTSSKSSYICIQCSGVWIAALFVSLSIQIKRIKFPTFNNQDAHCIIYIPVPFQLTKEKKMKARFVHVLRRWKIVLYHVSFCF